MFTSFKSGAVDKDTTLIRPSRAKLLKLLMHDYLSCHFVLVGMCFSPTSFVRLVKWFPGWLGLVPGDLGSSACCLGFSPSSLGWFACSSSRLVPSSGREEVHPEPLSFRLTLA